MARSRSRSSSRMRSKRQREEFSSRSSSPSRMRSYRTSRSPRDGRRRDDDRSLDGDDYDRNSEGRSDAQKRADRRRKRRTGWDTSSSSLGSGSSAAALAAAGALASTGLGGAFFSPGGNPLTPNSLISSQGLPTSSIAQVMQNKAMCRIYVGSLDYHLTENEVKQVFQAFGTIMSVDMPKEGNRSKGFCFVEFMTPEAADMALKTMQGFVLKGRTVKVGRPTAVGGVTFPTPATNGGVTGMPNLLTSTTSTAAPQPGVTGTSAPSGTSTQAGAMAAASLLAGRSGQSLDISAILQKVGGQAGAGAAAASAMAAGLSPQMTQFTQPQPNRIYVGNVPFSFSTEDLKQIFQVFGEISSCQLIPSNDMPGTHRGYGFIEFTNADQAKLAIDTMNGFEVAGKQLKVNYATALRNNGPIPLLSPLSPNLMSLQGAATPSVGTSTTLAGATGANQIPLGQPPSHSSPPPPPPSISPTMPGTVPSLPSAAVASSFPDSNIIMLTNMVTPDEVDEELKDEIREECSKYGEISNVYIHLSDAIVNIFVTFTTSAAAATAAPSLNDRWFGGRQIVCSQYNPHAYSSGVFTE